MKKLLTILLSNGQTVTTIIDVDEEVTVDGINIDPYYEEKQDENDLDEIVESYKEYTDEIELTNMESLYDDFILVVHKKDIYSSIVLNDDIFNYSVMDFYEEFYNKIDYNDYDYDEDDDLTDMQRLALKQDELYKFPELYNYLLNYALNSYNQLLEDYKKLSSSDNNKFTKTRLFLKDEINALYDEVFVNGGFSMFKEEDRPNIDNDLAFN